MDIFAKLNLAANDAFDFFMKEDGLLLKVYLECVKRARRNGTGLLGYDLLEFGLSRTEFAKFGLDKTQDKRIERSINTLIKLDFIKIVANKTGNKNSKVFRLVNGKFDLIEIPIANKTGDEQPTDSQQIAIKEDSKNRKNKEKNIKKRNFEKPSCMEVAEYCQEKNLIVDGLHLLTRVLKY